MTKGVNYPKGLLAWADEKGIDWCVSQLDDLYNEYHAKTDTVVARYYVK